MSEHSTPEERTEMPTEKRMTKLREDGGGARRHIDGGLFDDADNVELFL